MIPSPLHPDLVGKATKTARQVAMHMASNINRRLAAQPRQNKIVIITAFCLSMGIFCTNLLYEGLTGSANQDPRFSTGASISPPVSPLLSDSTVEVIRKQRLDKKSHSIPPSDSVTK